jgi:Domain of unknown function (DUF4907)
METKKHNRIVLIISAAIAISIPFILLKRNNREQHFESKIFRVTNGWGYDILVNDKLLIHQESVPAKRGQNGFAQKEQAQKTANLVINKIERGLNPALTTFEIEQICSENNAGHDQPE